MLLAGKSKGKTIPKLIVPFPLIGNIDIFLPFRPAFNLNRKG